jgi:hypothetical protein
MTSRFNLPAQSIKSGSSMGRSPRQPIRRQNVPEP